MRYFAVWGVLVAFAVVSMGQMQTIATEDVIPFSLIVCLMIGGLGMVYLHAARSLMDDENVGS